MKKVLIISFFFPPMNAVTGYCTGVFTDYLSTDCEIDIVTSVFENVDQKVLYKKNITIYPVKDTYSFFQKKICTTLKNNNDCSSVIDKFYMLYNDYFKRLLDKCIRKIMKNVCWPDMMWIWKKYASQKIDELLSNEKYDIVISISYPFSTHLCARELKKRYTDIYWAAVFVDLFAVNKDASSNNYFFYKTKNYKVERSIFMEADSVFISSEQLNFLTNNAIYKELVPKLKKINLPLALKEHERDNRNTFFKNHDNIKIAYVGTLYKRIRRADYLVEVFFRMCELSNSSEFELHFAGISEEDLFKHLGGRHVDMIGKSIFAHGIMPREKALDMLMDADVAINIGNTLPQQRPGKVYELLSLGKPIINIRSLINDPSKEFLEKYPILLDIIEDWSDIDFNAQKFLDFVKINAGKLIEDKQLKRIIGDYQESSIGNSFKNELLKEYLNWKSSNVSKTRLFG